MPVAIGTPDMCIWPSATHEKATRKRIVKNMMSSVARAVEVATHRMHEFLNPYSSFFFRGLRFQRLLDCWVSDA
jgi:hypothetical protein